MKEVAGVGFSTVITVSCCDCKLLVSSVIFCNCYSFSKALKASIYS